MSRRTTIRWAGAGVLVVAAVGLVLAVASRGGSSKRVFKAPEGAPLRFAFVPNNDDDFWRLAEAGARRFERESGVTVDVRVAARPGPQAQNELLATLAGEGYHGIAVSVISPAEQAAAVNAAAARTNVVCIDSDAPGTGRLAYVGTNNYLAGRLLGDRIVTLLPAGGRMAVFVGTKDAENARERLRGIKDAVDGHGVDPVDVYQDDTDARRARQKVEEAMAKHPDTKLLCGLWSYNGPAIADAIDAGGLRGRVVAVAFDEAEGTLCGIESGTIDCTVVQQPSEFGYQSCKRLYELATRGKAALPDKDGIDTGAEVIDRKNLPRFRGVLAEMRD